MSNRVREMIKLGTMKVVIKPVSNIQTYQLQLAELSPTEKIPMLSYTPVQLAQGVEFSLVSQNIYLLDLLLTPTGSCPSPCTVTVCIEHNKTVIWDQECTWFDAGINGKWKFTIQ